MEKAALSHTHSPKPASPSADVAVKALEWGSTSYGTPEVYSVVGVYRINHAGDGGYTVVIKNEVLRTQDGRRNFPTIEAAKAAAQADYETRVRSALIVPPSTDTSGTGDEAIVFRVTDPATGKTWFDDDKAGVGTWRHEGYVVEPFYARPLSHPGTSEPARLYGPYGWLIKPDGLGEEEWRLENGPSDFPDEEESVALYATEDQRLGKPAVEETSGWIVANGSGDRFRTWADGFSAWTEDRNKATRYARRIDAENVHREDEYVWCIVPFSPSSEKTSGDVAGREAFEEWADAEGLDLRRSNFGDYYYYPETHKAHRAWLAALSRHIAPDAHSDDLAVDRFAVAMKAKLARKRDQGYGGWDDKADCSQEHLSGLLQRHVEKGDPVDVANLAMMLHQRGERIAVLPHQPAPQGGGDALREAAIAALDALNRHGAATPLVGNAERLLEAALSASFTSANGEDDGLERGWRVSEGGHFGSSIVVDAPRGADMILVCCDTYQHVPKQILLPHQLYVEKAVALLDETGAKSITVIPYRNADKVEISAADLRALPANGEEAQNG